MEEGGGCRLGLRDSPEGLFMSCLEPLQPADITVVIQEGNFFIGHSLHTPRTSKLAKKVDGGKLK